MKQELKQILKNEINAYQIDRAYFISEIVYNEMNCDKAKSECMSSAYHFEQLNEAKNYLRKIDKKLKKLREMQSIIKNIDAFLIYGKICPT